MCAMEPLKKRAPRPLKATSALAFASLQDLEGKDFPFKIENKGEDWVNLVVSLVQATNLANAAEEFLWNNARSLVDAARGSKRSEELSSERTTVVEDVSSNVTGKPREKESVPFGCDPREVVCCNLLKRKNNGDEECTYWDLGDQHGSGHSLPDYLWTHWAIHLRQAKNAVDEAIQGSLTLLWCVTGHNSGCTYSWTVQVLNQESRSWTAGFALWCVGFHTPDEKFLESWVTHLIQLSVSCWDFVSNGSTNEEGKRWALNSRGQLHLDQGEPVQASSASFLALNTANNLALLYAELCRVGASIGSLELGLGSLGRHYKEVITGPVPRPCDFCYEVIGSPTFLVSPTN